MPTFESSPQYEHGEPESLGILLVNIGTPDAPTPAAVRRFLRQFLGDPRVIEYPRVLWWLVLNGVILLIRPSRSARAYQQIWTEHGSPLLLHSQDIVSAVQNQLSARLSGVTQVELAMTYGNPSIQSGLERLHAAGARRIIVLPLFPQYSGTTTAAVFDSVSAALRKRRWIPEFRLINHYHDAPGYIAAHAANIRDHWEQNGKGDKLVFSFHGLPISTIEKGDPYFCQCQKTARLIASSLDLNDDDWTIAFQSRVGREEWLQPFTDEVLKKLGRDKLARVDVVCPGFAVDCLETLEEIAIRYASLFSESGGGALNYIPALNARDDHIAFLVRLIERNAAGWPESSPDWTASESAHELDKSRQRALAAGASR